MTSQSKPGKRLATLDLFAGCGGLSAGLAMSGGFDIVAACEHWKPAADTYRLNHPGTIVIEGDVTRKKVKDDICKPFSTRKCDVVVGGVPCQAYSISGRRDSEDPRFFLYEEFLDIVGRLKPTLTVIENVTGILSARHSDGSSGEQGQVVYRRAGTGCLSESRDRLFIGSGYCHALGHVHWNHVANTIIRFFGL